MTERVFLGLGSNLGNREQNLCTALRWLAPGCSVVAVSSLYRSGAMVLPDAPPGPDFLNAACEVVTALSPEDLLAHLQSIEHSLGRRAAPRWARAARTSRARSALAPGTSPRANPRRR